MHWGWTVNIEHILSDTFASFYRKMPPNHQSNHSNVLPDGNGIWMMTERKLWIYQCAECCIKCQIKGKRPPIIRIWTNWFCMHHIDSLMRSTFNIYAKYRTHTPVFFGTWREVEWNFKCNGRYRKNTKLGQEWRIKEQEKNIASSVGEAFVTCAHNVLYQNIKQVLMVWERKWFGSYSSWLIAHGKMMCFKNVQCEFIMFLHSFDLPFKPQFVCWTNDCRYRLKIELCDIYLTIIIYI